MITRFFLWVGLDWPRNYISWIILTAVLKYWEVLFKRAEREMDSETVIRFHFWLEDMKSEHFFYWSKA